MALDALNLSGFNSWIDVGPATLVCRWCSVPFSLWPDVQEPGPVVFCVPFQVSLPETYTSVSCKNVSLSQPTNEPGKPLQLTSISSSLLCVD